MSKIPRSKKPVKLPDPDPKVLSFIESLYMDFVLSKARVIRELEECFMNFFNGERIISFRLKMPKGLNSKGEAALTDSKLWTLWAIISYMKTSEPFSEILKIFKCASEIVNNKTELMEGLHSFLELFSEIRITEEDEKEFKSLSGEKVRSGPLEVIAISDCNCYALVKLTTQLANKLRSNMAVCPIDQNLWVIEAHCETVLSLQKMLAKSAYAYHPQPTK